MKTRLVVHSASRASKGLRWLQVSAVRLQPLREQNSEMVKNPLKKKKHEHEYLTTQG